MNLPVNSMQNWQQMEEALHNQFYWMILEVSMVDLSRLYHLSGAVSSGLHQMLQIASVLMQDGYSSIGIGQDGH